MANKLRPADETLAAAVATTIDSLDTTDADRAAIELAKHYANAIDTKHCDECEADTSLDNLGPRLLAVLETLGATPAARARITKGGGAANAPTGRLQSLREARGA